MFFRAQNLGPLRDAEIDLSKDLIVLAGPNNAGKTYLAWSVYGLHRTPLKMAGSRDDLARRLLESPEYSISMTEVFAEDGSSMLEEIAKQCHAKLHLCFATEGERFAATEISLRIDRVGTSAFIFYAQIGYGLPTVVLSSNGTGTIYLLLSDEDDIHSLLSLVQNEHYVPANWYLTTKSVLAALSDEKRDAVILAIGRQLVKSVPRALLPRCILFPAERIAVNIFAKELTLRRNALVDELVDADLDEQPEKPLELIRHKAGRYPWPIRDSLRDASDLANLSKNRTVFADLADDLERAILGGTVNVSEQGELLFAPEVSPEIHLAIHLTASVVKSLTSLVFYFRHMAEKGDFLIIDEPELNLHPDNQRKIARILAKAVRRGFKVMISTHSDYVLRELNHLIMLNKLPAEEARELGYDPEFALDPAKVGVYLVDDHHTESIPIEETGFSIKTIDAVVNQLNIDEQRLYARLAD